MTTYRLIASTETDPQAPYTSALAKAMDLNLAASLEADSTAPVNQGNWHPYNKVTNGDSNDGKFYDFAVNGLQTTVVTPDFVDGYEYRVEWYGISHNNGANQDFRVEFYREAGAAYNAAFVMLAAQAAATLLTGQIELPNVRLSRQWNYCPWWIANTTANDTTSTNALNMVNRMTTAQKVTRLRFGFAAGSIDAGTMFLFRRRLIV